MDKRVASPWSYDFAGVSYGFPKLHFGVEAGVTSVLCFWITSCDLGDPYASVAAGWRGEEPGLL